MQISISYCNLKHPVYELAGHLLDLAIGGERAWRVSADGLALGYE